MCLIVIAWQQSAAYPLVLAGNRDEFHQRPTQDAHWWPDFPDILGGRDLQAGGTWLALHRSGRFAAVTNFREAQTRSASLNSRGQLVTDFLLGDATPMDFLASIKGERFAGFNLIVGDSDSLAYGSNRGGDDRLLEPGIYGLSNALLDADWYKAKVAKTGLRSLVENDGINSSNLLRLLNNRDKAPASDIEARDFDFATAHAISAPFIVLPEYGTRSSSVLIRAADGGAQFVERRFDPAGQTIGHSELSIAAGNNDLQQEQNRGD